MTLTAAGLLFMPAANAQQQSPSGLSVTAPSPTTTPANIPDKKLDAAAAAVKKVSAVKGCPCSKMYLVSESGDQRR
jgi:hypothetical protein